MPKKRCMIAFLILLALAVPVFAMECVTYKQCDEARCIGGARMCVEGICMYTGCINQAEGSTLELKGREEQRVVDSILMTSLKMLGFAVVATLMVVIFVIMNQKGKAALGIALLLGISTMIIGIYLFYGNAAYMISDAGIDTSSLDEFFEAKDLDVEKEGRFRPNENIDQTVEYKLSDRDSEYSLLIIDPAGGTRPQDIGLYEEGTEPISLLGRDVVRQERTFYDKYVWEQSGLIFVLSGQESGKLAAQLIMLDPPTRDGSPTQKHAIPLINITEPHAEYTGSNLISFKAYRTDSDIDSVSVSGVSGFDERLCKASYDMHECSFYPDLTAGEHTVSIEVTDTEGFSAQRSISFTYDPQDWMLTFIYPQKYTFTPDIYFQVLDESGIRNGSFSISGINKSLESCKKISGGIECKFSSMDLTEGEIEAIVAACDNSGNCGQRFYNFTYDQTKPEIELIAGGFIVRDNIGIDEESLFVNNRRFSITLCEAAASGYICTFSDRVYDARVSDLAGNNVYLENKLER